MFYKSFKNLMKRFQVYLTLKQQSDINHIDFMDMKFNCDVKFKKNGICPNQGKCKNSMILFEAE